MIKLFKNCIKDMYKNILQIFSIILFVFFMTALLTGILFSNNYVWNQFQSISANNQPEDKFSAYENLKFNQNINGESSNLFWKNMIYVDINPNNSISLDKNKFNLATLKIVKINDQDKKEILNKDNSSYFQAKENLIYKIIYSHPSENINIGYDINKKDDKGYFYIDASFYENNKNDKFNYIELFSKYASKGIFNLITTDDEKILQEISNKLKYKIDDQTVEEHKRLYWAIVNSLFYEYLESYDELIINDLLVSGKSYCVKKFTRDDIFGRPFVTKFNNNFNFNKGNYGFIFERFAFKNNLKLNDEINIGGTKIIIDGYAVNENYVYFLLSGRVIPNLLDTTVVWVNEKTYNEINKNILSSIKKENKSLLGYARKKNSIINNRHSLNASEFFSGFKDMGEFKILNWHKTAANINRLSLSARLNVINSIALAFSILLVTITITIIFILLFKIIVRNSGILGTIKAFGGSMKIAALNLSLVTSLPVFIASVSGSVMGLLVMYFLNYSYRDFFILPEYGVEYNWWIAAGSIFIPLLIIFVVSFLLTLLILGKPPLVLLNQHFKIFNHVKIFSRIAQIKWKWVSYKTKITWSFMAKSFSILLLTLFITISSSSLLYFTLSTREMSTNLLERQWQGINFKYGYVYKQYPEDLAKWQIDKNNFNEWHYEYKNKNDLDIKDNIFYNLIGDYSDIFKEKNYNLRGKWIKSSELKILVDFIMYDKKLQLLDGTSISNDIIPDEIKDKLREWIIKEDHLIKYFTGQNNNTHDLIISFGNIIYDDHDSLMWNTNTLDTFVLQSRNNKQFISYNNILKWGMNYYSMSFNNLKYLSPKLWYSDYETFFNFNLEDWKKEEKNIISRNKNQLDNLTSEGYTYKIIPAAVSRNYVYHGELIYPELKEFQHYRKENKQIILHYVYDYIDNLQNSIIVPQKLFQTYFNLPETYFNTKLTNTSVKEFQTYFSFTNAKYDLFIDNNINNSGWENVIDGFLDIANNKQLSENFNGSISTLITLFGIFAVIIALSIIFVVCNIILKENSHFINVFRAIGYSKAWISSLFWVIFIPIVIVSAFIAIFIAEPLINILISVIFSQTGVLFPVIFYWWFYLAVFIIILGSFVIAFSFSWYLTLKRLKLSNVNISS